MTTDSPSPHETMTSLHDAMTLIEGGHVDASALVLHNLMERFYEAAAREKGWHRSKVDGKLILHRTEGSVYENWRECCECAGIEVLP